MKIKIKKAISFRERLLGLIDKNNHPPMLFETRFGVHTFFLSKKIDVLVLDQLGVVKKIKTNLKPFSFFFYNPMHKNVIELEVGFILKNNICLGDKIELVHDHSNS